MLINTQSINDFFEIMVVLRSAILILFGSLIAGSDVKSNPENCGPQKCTSNGELVCAIYNGNYKVFSDTCDLKAHQCDFGENYQPVSMETCPPEALQWPRPCSSIEDWVCATADNENYKLFKNNCELVNFQSVLRRVWRKVPLVQCSKLPDMPPVCAEGDMKVGDNVCGFTGERYEIIDSLSALYQLKCHKDGNWQKVSMIYC